MATTPDLATVKAQITAEFPSFKIVNKSDSTLMKLISCFMVASFMSNFVTTIWNTVYVPSNWATYSVAEQCSLLRHESIHMRQAKSLTFPLFGFLYLCVFFPIGLSYFRAKFEMEAYAETLASYKDYGESYSDPATQAWLTTQFVGPNYGWMWPFKSAIISWFNATVAKLNA